MNFRKLISSITLISLFVSIISFVAINLSPTKVYADGTYSNIGTATGTNAGSDAVPWSQGNPIMIDRYGNLIVPIENASAIYTWAVASSITSSWSELTGTGLTFRPAAVYDSRNDKIHVLINTSSGISYKKFMIKRNADYTINSISLDPASTSMAMDNIGSCSSVSSDAYPTLLWKDNGANGILTAFWGIKKTCSSVTKYQSRASMITLANTSADSVASNWAALNGVTDTGTDAAIVPFNNLYSYTGTAPARTFIHAALIRGGSGAKSEDIYYFNFDENSTFGFRRLAWNSGSNNWSGSWTSRVTFGGNVTNNAGYGGKDELITKPVFNSSNNKVYLGIARYLGGGLGDTQSLYDVDTSDAITLDGNLYSANGAAWFAPTMDITYNSQDQKIYYFFQTSTIDPNNSASTNSSFNGHTYYKTYDGSTFSSAVAYFTASNLTMDIPIVYQSDYRNKIILFHRIDGAETPFTPPHNIYSGYVPAGGTYVASQSITSPYSASTYVDFQSLCDTKSNTYYKSDAGGEIGIQPTLRDDFEAPISPYVYPFAKWQSGTYGASSFTPTLTGTNIKVYSSPDGAFLDTVSTNVQKTIEFKAQFTTNSFQHIGFVSDENFNDYRMFSTKNQGSTPGHLFARDSDNGDIDLGTGYLGAYHLYKIDWNAIDTKFYIDGSLVATRGVTSAPMRFFASNNDTSIGSDMRIDSVRIIEYPTSGTYTSCALDSSTVNANWGVITFNTTTPSGETVQLQTRTSTDGLSWSSYSSVLTSGSTIPSPAGRYLQYKLTFAGDGTDTASLNNINIAFAPASTPTPTTTIITTTATTTAVTTTTAITTTASSASSLIYLGSTLISNGTIPTVTSTQPIFSGVDINAYRVVIASNSPQTFFVTPNGSGNWSISNVAALSNGNHTITVFNNVGTILSSAAFIVDTSVLTNTGQTIISSFIFGTAILFFVIAIVVSRKRKLKKQR